MAHKYVKSGGRGCRQCGLPANNAVHKVDTSNVRYGVFMHIPNYNGMVVRSGTVMANGDIAWPSPYNNAKPESIYKSETAAQKRADALNAHMR